MVVETRNMAQMNCLNYGYMFYDDTITTDEFDTIFLSNYEFMEKYIFTHPEPTSSQISKFQEIFDNDNTPDKLRYRAYISTLMKFWFDQVGKYNNNSMKKSVYANRIFCMLMYFGQYLFHTHPKFFETVTNKIEEFKKHRKLFDYKFFKKNIMNPNYSKIKFY